MDSAIAPAKALPVVITPAFDELVFGHVDKMPAGNYLPEFADFYADRSTVKLKCSRFWGWVTRRTFGGGL